MDTIGIVGLGTMGFEAACKISDSGYSLVVFDTAESALQKAESLGAARSENPMELAGKAEVILMFLPGPAEVEQCVTGEKGLLSCKRSGFVIADMSTVDPGITVRMADRARRNDVGYLDAPILGRPSAVGNWALPVGGNPDVLDRCRPVFKCVASAVMHVGPSGTGNKIKLLNQLMFGAINAATAEMMAVAEKAGISPKLLYDAITTSRAGTVSNLFKELGRHIVEEDYDDPAFTVELLIKDIRLGVKMARENDAPPLLSRTVEHINEMAHSQGFGKKDTSIMWKCFGPMWSGGNSR